MSSNIVLLTQAFRTKFVIPDFEEFTSHVDRIFEDAKELTGGKVREPGCWARYTLLLGDFLALEAQLTRDEKQNL